MSLECERLLARLGIPDLHRPVKAAANDPLPVGAETHARDNKGVSFECERLLAGLGIPDLHRVTFATDDLRPVGAEIHAEPRTAECAGSHQN